MKEVREVSKTLATRSRYSTAWTGSLRSKSPSNPVPIHAKRFPRLMSGLPDDEGDLGPYRNAIGAKEVVLTPWGRPTKLTGRKRGESMKCPACQQDNPPGARFCGECATPLASVCAECGAANQVG